MFLSVKSLCFLLFRNGLVKKRQPVLRDANGEFQSNFSDWIFDRNEKKQYAERIIIC